MEKEDQKKQEPPYNYVTIVLRYFEKTKKNSHNVTDVLSTLLESLQIYNQKQGYDGTKFELYGVVVESDSDIAQSKNDLIKEIK